MVCELVRGDEFAVNVVAGSRCCMVVCVHGATRLQCRTLHRIVSRRRNDENAAVTADDDWSSSSFVVKRTATADGAVTWLPNEPHSAAEAAVSPRDLLDSSDIRRLWCDDSVEPGHEYTYRVHRVEQRDGCNRIVSHLDVRVTTESESPDKGNPTRNIMQHNY